MKLLNDLMIKLNLNCHIIEAHDGIDILKSIIDDQRSKNYNIKCVFSDECMEYVDGSRSFEILRELELYKNLRPVAKVSITSFDDENYKRLILDRGANYLLTKPCSLFSLEKVVKDIFEI